MSAHVLLNSSNKLRKEIKCKACQAFLSLSQQFNEFNNTGTQMLDSFLSK